ncbi:hypothetical protein SUGI_0701280 [Cryptomeria japonica]|nr:hypothetical protein SUGI_0701280 [Cryptomeria japonica]
MFTPFAIFILSQCLHLKILVTKAEDVSLSFELHGKTLVRLYGDAVVMDETLIQLTNSTLGLGGGTAGRVVYGDTIPLWNASTKSYANFTTHFQFQINWTRNGDNKSIDYGGDGLAFCCSLVLLSSMTRKKKDDVLVYTDILTWLTC